MKTTIHTLTIGVAGLGFVCLLLGPLDAAETKLDRVRRHYATPPAIRHFQREYGLTPENTPDADDTMFDRIQRHYGTPPHVRRQQRVDGYAVPGSPGPDDSMLDRIRRHYATPPAVRLHYRNLGEGYPSHKRFRTDER